MAEPVAHITIVRPWWRATGPLGRRERPVADGRQWPPGLRRREAAVHVFSAARRSIADRIVRSACQPHRHYAEPFAWFAGRAADQAAIVGRKKPSATLTATLVNFWRCLRDRPGELIRACAPDAALARPSYQGRIPGFPGRPWNVRGVHGVVISQGRAGTLKRSGWRYSIAPQGPFRIYCHRTLRATSAAWKPIAQRLSRVDLGVQAGSRIDQGLRRGRGRPAVCRSAVPRRHPRQHELPA